MKAFISCIVSAILLSTSIFAQETQSLKVPFIAGLEQMDFQELQLALETGGGRVKASQEEMSEIIRFSSLPKEQIDKENAIFEWMVALVIPYPAIGLDPNNLPEKIQANFYKCGEETAHPHYLSWNPIKTSRPDFHRPEYFGELKLK